MQTPSLNPNGRNNNNKKAPFSRAGRYLYPCLQRKQDGSFFPSTFPATIFPWVFMRFFFISTCYNTRQTLAHLDTLSSLSSGWFYLPTINRRNILCICSRQNYISFPWMPQLANCIKEGKVIWEKSKCMRYYAKVACWLSTHKWMLRGKQESFLSGFLL